MKKINWDNYPTGTKFTATIDGTKTQGRIQKQKGDIFLCQNERNGAYCDDKLGYKWSWWIGNGSNLKSLGVTNLKLTLDKSYSDFIEPDFKITGSKVKVNKNYATINEYAATFDEIEKIYAAMCSLKYG